MHHLACRSIHTCCSLVDMGGGGGGAIIFNYLFHVYFNAISDNFQNKFMGGAMFASIQT